MEKVGQRGDGEADREVGRSPDEVDHEQRREGAATKQAAAVEAWSCRRARIGCRKLRQRRNGELEPLLHCPEGDRRAGPADRGESSELLLQEASEVAGRGAADLQQKAVLAGDVMHLLNLRQARQELRAGGTPR